MDKVIDFHTHLGRDLDGSVNTAGQILAQMKANGVAKTVIFPFNSRDKTFFSENNRIAEISKSYPCLIGFARLNPWWPGCLDEMDRVMELGLKGFKMHPRAQDFTLLDIPDVLEKIDRLGVPLLLHSRHLSGQHVRHIRELAPSYSFPIVMGHAGLGDAEGTVRAAVEHPNVFLEVSINFSYIVRLLLEDAGAEKVIFGTDSPYMEVGTMLDRVLGIQGLSDEDLHLVLYGNAARILGL